MAFLARFKQSFSFITDSFSELKKVKWPSRKELTSYTLVVLITVAFVSLFFFILDLGISGLIRLVFER